MNVDDIFIVKGPSSCEWGGEAAAGPPAGLTGATAGGNGGQRPSVDLRELFWWGGNGT